MKIGALRKYLDKRCYDASNFYRKASIPTCYYIVYLNINYYLNFIRILCYGCQNK